MFLERLGNLLTGRGFTSNSQADEEEKKKRRQPAPQVSAPMARPGSLIQQGGRQPIASLVQAEQEQAPMPVAIQATQTLKPRSELDGLAEEDQQLVKKLRARGSDPEAIGRFIAAARAEAKAKEDARITPMMIGEEIGKATYDMAIKPAVETAKVIPTAGVASYAGLTGDRVLQAQAQKELDEHVRGSIPGSLFNSLGVIGTKIAAPLAVNDLIKQGIDPNIALQSADSVTSQFGVRSDMSDLENITSSVGAAVDIGTNVAAIGQAGDLFVKAVSTLEKSLGRALSTAERAALASGRPAGQIVQEAASLGNGLSTPTTVAKAQNEVAQVAQAGQAVQTAVAAPVARPSLFNSIKETFPPMTGRVGQRGSIRIPGGMADDAASELADLRIRSEAAGSKEERALVNRLIRAVEQGDGTPVKAKRLEQARANLDSYNPENIAPTKAQLTKEAAPLQAVPEIDNLDADIIRDEIKQLDNLARQREAAGASDSTLDPIYQQIDIKTAELERMLKPQKVTKAQQKAAAANEQIAVAQQQLEQAVGIPAKPKVAPVIEPIEKPLVKATKKQEIAAVKAEAQSVEVKKQAIKEQVQVQKKIRKAVAKAEGKADQKIKAAPKVAQFVGKTFADDPDGARTLASMGSKRDKASYIDTTIKSIAKVSKQSDDEVLNDAMKADFGRSDVEPYDQLIHALDGILPRLRRMKKATDDPEQVKKMVTAIDNIMERTTKASSQQGTGLGAMGYIMKNAGPELLHARAVKKFEDLGGKIDPKDDARLFETQESVYTAQKEIDRLKDDHAALLDRLDKDKKIKDSEWKEMEAAMKRQEAVLENSLAENERIAGEIFERNVKAGNITDDAAGKGFGSSFEGWLKASMLSAPTGRARDIGTSGIAIADKMAVDFIEGIFGKATRSKNVRTSVAIDPEAIIKGTKEGIENFKQIARGEKRGGIYVDSGPEGLDRKFKGAKGKLSPAPKKANKIVRGINATSAAGTEFFRGYEPNRLLQHLDVIGRQKGYTGAKLQQFKKISAINPPDDIRRAAEQDFLVSSAMHDNPIYRFVDEMDQSMRSWANKSNITPAQRRARNAAVRTVSLLTLPFKKYAAGTLYRLGTDQNIGHNALGLLKATTWKRDPQRALTHAARLTVNSAKLGVATVALAPFLVDKDGNNKDYSPPYLHFGGDSPYIPLAALGPVLAAPLGAAYANRKFEENLQEHGSVARAIAEHAYVYGTIMLQSTGMDSIAAGDSPLVRFVTGTTGGVKSQEGMDVFSRTGGRLGQDIATMAVPSVFRDANAVIDWVVESYVSGNQYAPETMAENADGNKDYIQTGINTVLASLPGVRQYMAAVNPGTKANPSLLDRTLGSTSASDAMKQEKADGETKESIKANAIATSSERISRFYGNEKIAGIFDDETKLLYEQAQDPKRAKKLSESDYEQIESSIKKAEEKFLYDSDYDTYLLAVEARREKTAADPAISKKDLENIDWDINVAKRLREAEVPYDDYNMYAGSSKSGNDAGNKAGISVSDMKKMLDPDDDMYDPETAERLLQIDQFMAEAGLSDHENNVKKPKYESLLAGGSASRKASRGRGGGGGGGGSVGSPSIGSGVSRKTLNPGGDTLQYRDLTSYNSPIPNLSKQAARTNFKKNITVKRGVAL